MNESRDLTPNRSLLLDEVVEINHPSVAGGQARRLGSTRAQHPTIADEIRQLIPALVMVRTCGVTRGEPAAIRRRFRLICPGHVGTWSRPA